MRGGGGGASTQEAPLLVSVRPSPLPPLPQFLSWYPQPAVPRAPSAQPLYRAPSGPPRGPHPPDALRHLGLHKGAPRPHHRPLIGVSSRFVFSGCTVLPAPRHPAEQSGPLLARAVLGRLCSASGCLPSLLAVQWPRSRLLPPAPPACSPPGPSVSGVAPPPGSPPTSRHSVSSVEAQSHASPAPPPPPKLCARVTQAHVWLPGSVDTEAVRLKRFVSSIHERYRGMDRAGAETASDPRAALSSRPPWGRGRLRLVLLPLWSQAGDLRSLDPLCR